VFFLNFGFLSLIVIIPNYAELFGLNYSSGLIYTALFLGIYVFWNHRYLKKLPTPVKVLCMGYFFSSLSFFSSFQLIDVTFSFASIGLTLSGMVILHRKLKDKVNYALVGWLGTILCLVVIYSSIGRNEIDIEGVLGQRRGFNLISFYCFIGLSYSLLLSGKSRWIVLALWLIAIAYLASRASAMAAFLVLMSYLCFSIIRYGTQTLRRVALGGFLFTIIAYTLVMWDTSLFQDLFSHSSFNRLADVSFAARSDSWHYWFGLFKDDPRFLGVGLESYITNIYMPNWIPPHNTYLHMFYGGGLLAGFFYLFFAVTYFRQVRKAFYSMTKLEILGASFMIAVVIRSFFEIDCIGTPRMHVISLLAAYMVGFPLILHSDHSQRTSLPEKRGDVCAQ
jgi:O-antigen ligase